MISDDAAAVVHFGGRLTDWTADHAYRRHINYSRPGNCGICDVATKIKEEEEEENKQTRFDS